MQCILCKTWKLREPEKPEKVYYCYTRKLYGTDIWKEKKLLVKVVLINMPDDFCAACVLKCRCRRLCLVNIIIVIVTVFRKIQN